MANEEHLAILKKGVRAWNAWKKRGPGIRPDLRGANLSKAKFDFVDFKWAYLEDANLMMSKFELADFSGASLSGAYAGKANFLAANFQGADLAHSRLELASFVRANLSEATLVGANMNDAELYRADLTSVNLSKATLRDADLSDSRLNFSTLDDADLTRAGLRGANLTATSLVGTVLAESVMGFTSLSNLDLSAVKGLETVLHLSPSTIGIDTIYESKGQIPEAFLRNAGVPESLVTYMKSLVVEPIEYYSCFISYSSKDDEFTKKLHRDLQGEGVRCWFAPEEMKIGDRIRPRIDEAIRVHDKLLLVLTESSMKSPWVEKEVETAFEKESKQGRTVLFPIRLDDEVMESKEAWAADIRRMRHIGDFCGWKDHDKYKKAFERLMRDLKA